MSRRQTCPECRETMRIAALNWRRISKTADTKLAGLCLASAKEFRDGVCHHLLERVFSEQQ